MSTLPEQPLDWSLELLPSGNFTARRQEWLGLGALGFIGMAFLLGLAAFLSFRTRDHATTAGCLFGFVLALPGVAMTSIRQKAFSRRDALVVAEDRRWPRSNRRVQVFDASDAAEFMLSKHEPAPEPQDDSIWDRPRWNFGVQPGWEVHVRLHSGATVRLFSELKDAREAAWLQWLGTQLLTERPAQRRDKAP